RVAHVLRASVVEAVRFLNAVLHVRGFDRWNKTVRQLLIMLGELRREDAFALRCGVRDLLTVASRIGVLRDPENMPGGAEIRSEVVRPIGMARRCARAANLRIGCDARRENGGEILVKIVAIMRILLLVNVRLVADDEAGDVP